MTSVLHGFERKMVEVPIDHIVPTVPVLAKILITPKFKTIVASIREIGIIEPLAVHPRKGAPGYYDLLDGHLRIEALKQLGEMSAPCMISLDDEGFTFNRHLNRTTAIQEHKMVRASLATGTPEASIAAALNMDVKRIREKAHLLDNIAPEVVSLLKDRHVIGKVFSILKKMKPIRQIEAVEMMIAANRFTATYASMILITTRPEGLSAAESKKKLEPEVSLENIARMEREMERLHQDYQAVEDGMGDTMLSLVVAKGFITRLLRNENIFKYLSRNHADLLVSLTTTTEAIAQDNRTPELE